jgi:glutathione peroxidase
MSQKSIYDFKVKDSSGQELSLEKFKGNVILVVNVASKCGFTPQYKGLEELFQKYREKGLMIVGFPCNQFGDQEPGSDQDIQQFCSLTYNVTFPVLAKVDVNGNNEAPVYKFLKSSAKGTLGTKGIKWNFTKFLIGKDGVVIKRYAPADKPESLTKDIEKALG